MPPRVYPWWWTYTYDNRLRGLYHNPVKILAAYVREGMTALDVGCGLGYFSLGLAKLVGDSGLVLAVDIQTQSLQILERRARQAGLHRRLRTHQAEPGRLGINVPVDFALLFWTLHEVADVPSLASQLHDCLVPGGKLLLTEPIFHVLRPYFDQEVQTLREVGLQIAETPRIAFSHAVVLAKK